MERIHNMYESLLNQINSKEPIRNHFGFTIHYNRAKNTYVLGDDLKNNVPFHGSCGTLKQTTDCSNPPIRLRENFFRR